MMNTILPAKLEAVLQEWLPQGMDWLRQMVSINTFTENPDGVNKLGSVTSDCFSSLRFAAETVESESPRYGRHLFLSRGDVSARPVVLVTHLDTVYPAEEEARNGFVWREAPGERRIYGPGVVDNK